MNAVYSGVIVKRLGRVAYAPTLEAMRAFTARRGPDAPDGNER